MVTEWSVRWKNSGGACRVRLRTRARRTIEDVLLLRWNCGKDFPVTIWERPAGDCEWHPSSWNALFAAISEPERAELRLRRDWVEAVDR